MDMIEVDDKANICFGRGAGIIVQLIVIQKMLHQYYAEAAYRFQPIYIIEYRLRLI